MMNSTIKTGVLALGVGLSFAGGLALGWKLYSPRPTTAETYKPAMRQADSSLILERKPDPEAKAPHQISKSAKLERTGQITFQPANEAKPGTCGRSQEAPASLPDVTYQIDWSLIQTPKECQRMVFSSPDGQIVGGVDIPVEPAKPAPKKLNWIAAATWNPVDNTFGAMVTRDIGPFVAGMTVHQTKIGPSLKQIDASIVVGIRF